MDRPQRWLKLILAFALIAATSVFAQAAATSAGAATGVAADGAHVVAEQQVDARTIDLTIDSPATNAQGKVRLLMPSGWSADATRTWPVLYLLHGCCDPFSGWTDKTDVAQLTANADVIVALPDGGPAGFYTDWYSGGANWEQFTGDELPQILASGYHAGAKRAIAGVSTGGGSALVIAAHRPGAYAAAASYSGMDCTLFADAIPLIQTTLSREGIDPNDLWGSPILQFFNWTKHDPCSLASSLRGTKVFLSVGTGFPGEGISIDNVGGHLLESAVAPVVYALTAPLRLSGVSLTTDFYTGGVHDWPNWQTELHKSWPMLAAALGVTP